MTTVETARGPVDVDALGKVLMHEHVWVLDHEWRVNHPDTEGVEDHDAVEAAVRRLDELTETGIGTIVDLTVTGLGRHMSLLQQVAERTSINIVVATGYYTFNELPHFVQHRARVAGREPADFLADVFVHDIEVGIARTGIRAGILKCATDLPGVTEGVEAVLRGVARAHRRTGTPISTHTHARSRRGLEQQDVFEQEGVDLGRVVIGHSGDTDDLDYLEELLARGSYLGMDRFGLYERLSKAQRIEVVAELCRRGHAARLVLSHDACCINDWLSPTMSDEGDWHHCHIARDVLPALRDAGVSDADLDLMLVENPRRFFAAA